MEKLTEEEQRKFYSKKATKANLIDWLIDANRKLEESQKFRFKLVGDKSPHKCPICEGRQILPHGFYSHGINSTTAINYETCRTCGGTGILWDNSSNPSN